MNLKYILKRLHLKILEKASNKMKINYLRKQGMKIGDNCLLNTFSFSTEPFLIEIGNHVAIAGGTEIITHDGATWCFLKEIPDADVFGKIIIGNNVFIGDNCTILPNTTIGDNCIVGAGSVVRGKFPENSVIIGNPAKIVMSMGAQKFLYTQNPHLLRTLNMPAKEKMATIKKHFALD